MRRSFEGKRHQPAKSEEKRKRCDRKHRGFGFFCAFLLCAGLISGGAAVSGESGAQEAVNAEAPADDAVQPEVPAQPVEEAQQNTPAPEDTEGGGEAGQQQEETPDQQQEELYPEDDGNGEESVPSVSRPDAGSAESSAAPVGTTAEPLTVSVTTAMKYAFAGENVLTFETQITGGTEPFETSCEIDRDGTPVWSSQEYQPEVTYMPEEAGGYELVLSVTDAAGQAASGRCAIPVAVRHEESPSDWEPALKEVRMTGRYAEDLLAIARTQLGYTESADNFIVTEEGARQGYTRYGQWQGDAYEPWDAAFAAFCLYYAGVRDVPADTKAEKWADELKRRGMYRDLTAENRPEEGDFLFTRDGEVTRIGLVEKTDDTGVTAIEGDVGGAVARVTYGWDDARLAGFGDPRTTLTDEAAGVTVTGIFPEGATLTVQLLAEDADGFTEAQDRIHAALSPLYDRYAVNLADVTETAVYVPSLTVNGEVVSPCKKVRVGVSACGGRFAGHGDVRVLTFSDEQTELLSAEEKDGGDGADAIVSASFRTDRLSEFALTAVAPDRLTMRRTAADGDAKVTVTYGAGAGVPESAELRVRQIRGDGDDADRAEYQKRQAEAAALLETEAGGENAASQPDTAASGSPGNAENADVSRQTDQNAENAAADQQADQNAENVAADQTEDSKEYAAYMEEVEAALASGRKVQMAKLFDITILDKEGNEVEPLTPVRANIEFVPKEVQEGTDLELYQFQTEGEKPQVMENVEVLTDDDNIVNGIEFETDGFSVYGIVGTEVLTGGVMTADGDSYSVTVKYDKYAEIPDDAVLVATEVQNSSRLYQSYMSEAEDALTSDSDAEISFARFFDVSIMADGEKIQPATPAEVIIDYNESQEITEGTEVSTLQFGDSVPATVDAAVSGTDTQVDGVSFQAEEVSVYGIVGTETISAPFTASDGNTYEVTVNYGKDAGIPEGARLEVSEVTKASTEYVFNYEEYVEKAADVINTEVEKINYVKLLDIKIVDAEGNKVIISAPVDVQIRLLDGNVDDTAEVVHFEDGAEKGNLIDNTVVNGETVSFDTDSFSIYAVIGGTDPNARMQVNFHIISYENDQEVDTTLSSVYVKRSDDLESLEMILYDPGVGALGDRESFRGWTFNKDYTVEEATSEFNNNFAEPYGAMTIDDVRNWADQHNIVEDPMEVINLYAMVLKHYTVTYLDRFGEASVDVDSAYMLRNETTANYTINKTYETNDEDYHFKGWVTKNEDKITTSTTPETVDVDTEGWDEDPYKLYKNNTSSVLSGDVTFKAHAPKGKWLIFHEVMKGATYTAPQFLEENESPNMPDEDIMLLLGYDFAGWYLDEGYTQPFTPGPITEKTNIYAKWDPATWAPYTVIIWKQNLDGTYAYADSIQLAGTAGTTVATTGTTSINQNQTGNYVLSAVNNNDADYLVINGQNYDHNTVQANYRARHTGRTGETHNYENPDYVGFNCSRIDQNVEINPQGNAVVNVYYDRITYTIKIYHARRSGNNYNVPTTRSNNSTLSLGGMNWTGTINYYQNGNTWSNGYQGPPAGVQTETSGNNTYYYTTITAKYGENIAAQWPKYEDYTNLDTDQNHNPGNNTSGYLTFVSWYMMNDAAGYRGNGSGLDTFKGTISKMDEKLLGDITRASADANYLIGRYDTRVINIYTYQIWKEALLDDDGNPIIPADKESKTGTDGKIYYLDDSIMSMLHLWMSNLHW